MTPLLLSALIGLKATLGTLTVAALVAAAVRIARVSGRKEVWRVLVLLVVAGFVWLRPGVKPLGTPSLVYTGVLCGLVVGAYVSLARPGIANRVNRVLSRTSFGEACGFALFASFLAVPAIATPILTHWDSSGWMDSHSYDAFAMSIATGKTPAGHSSYMPVYQYGLASIYYVFGHFFFVQQLLNGALALAGVALLSLAAWTVFQHSGAAALAAGVLAAYTPQLFAAIHTTQIEAWYVPLVCVVLLAWANYWRQPSMAQASWLAVAIALAVNTRNQGALFLGVIAMTPMLRPGLALQTRLRHVAIVVGLAAASLIPWTLRNVAVDGRWSPFADRSVMYIGILTDPRVGLYGVRYWEGWDEVAAEFQSRYPDPAEREKAYFDAAWTNITADPGWLGRAMVWRALGFYGLLPDGYLLLDRIEPPEWSTEWRKYVFSRMTPLVLLPMTLIALVIRPTAPMLMLGMASTAGVAIVLASATSEDRLSYPSLPVHILIVAGLFMTAASVADMPVQRATPRRRMVLVVAAAVMVGFALLARSTIGSRYAYRPLMEPSTTVRDSVSIDPVVPPLAAGAPLPLLPAGSRARARMMVSNYMFPPKYAGPVPSVPRFASDPRGAQYFYGYLLTEDQPPQLGTTVGVTFSGAELSHFLREGDVAEVEAVVMHHSPGEGLWLRVDRARKLDVSPETLPALP